MRQGFTAESTIETYATQFYLQLSEPASCAYIWPGFQHLCDLLSHDIVDRVRRVQRVQPEVLVHRHTTALVKAVWLRSSAEKTMSVISTKKEKEDRETHFS